MVLPVLPYNLHIDWKDLGSLTLNHIACLAIRDPSPLALSLHQLCDGHSRLGAEDGLMFGSVHPVMALEVVFWLQVCCRKDQATS